MVTRWVGRRKMASMPTPGVRSLFLSPPSLIASLPPPVSASCSSLLLPTINPRLSRLLPALTNVSPHPPSLLSKIFFVLT